jgi:hypothetical protein
MSEGSIVTLIVSIISASGAIGASVAGYLVQKNQRSLERNQRVFRRENSDQHGATLALIKEIQITTHETKDDVRALRSDFDSHVKQDDQPVKIRAVRSTANGNKTITKPKSARSTKRAV